MTTIFSWMLTGKVRQVRIVLAEDVVIHMNREWEAEQWMVRFATLHSHAESALRRALTETEFLEEDGFTLTGSVCTVETDIKPSTLYGENSFVKPPGPFLQSLFRLTWAEL